jgi:hypothetical protein
LRCHLKDLGNEVTTRRQAKARGLKRYYGTICPVHPELKGERRTASGNCLKCKQASTRRWHKANPEVHRKKVRKYRTVHRQKYLAGAHVRNALRRARKRDATEGDHRHAFAMLSREARLLGMVIDHIIPLAPCRVCGAKGDHAPWNWQLLTPSPDVISVVSARLGSRTPVHRIVLIRQKVGGLSPWRNR